jgi:hypothetical protein
MVHHPKAILDTHRKLLNVKKPSSVAVLYTLKLVRLAYYHTPFKRHKSFLLPIHALSGTHAQSMSQWSQGLKTLL